MLIHKTSKNDNSKLVRFTKDLEHSRLSKVTNFKEGDIYSIDYLNKYENIAKKLLEIHSGFKSSIEYIDTIPEEQPALEIENIEIEALVESQEQPALEIEEEPKTKAKKTKKEQ
jgi:hypothetical protein